MENRWARHHDMLAAVEAWAPKAGFRFLPKDRANYSPTVSSLFPPDGVSPDDLNKALKKEGYTPGSGYGKFKASNIRIGHMGDVDVLSVKNYLAAIEAAAARVRAAAPVAPAGTTA